MNETKRAMTPDDMPGLPPSNYPPSTVLFNVTVVMSGYETRYDVAVKREFTPDIPHPWLVVDRDGARTMVSDEQVSAYEGASVPVYDCTMDMCWTCMGRGFHIWGVEEHH